MKELIDQWFSYSKKDRNQVVVLFVLIILGIFLPYTFDWFNEPPSFSDKAFEKEVLAFKNSIKEKNEVDEEEAELVLSESDKPLPEKSSAKSYPEPIYFDFDPNKASKEAFQKMGLSGRVANVILNFREKGGHFYKPEDFKKIYGIDSIDYVKLEPYIKIEKDTSNAKFTYKNKKAEIPDWKKEYEALTININQADTIEFQKLNGIGPAYSKRILKYRGALGGFHSKEQIKEVYGIDSILYANIESKLVIEKQISDQININTASYDQLKKHPYLSGKIAGAIVNYRKQHGDFDKIDDLLKIYSIDEELLQKLAPYINVSN